MAQLVKNPPAMQETWVWSLHWEDPLERETHSSILAFWPGEFHGLCSPWGHGELDMTEWHIRTFAHGLPHSHFTLFSLKFAGLGRSCHSDFTLNITSSLKLFLTTLNVLVVQLITSPSFKSLHSCEHYLACSCFLNLSLFLCCLRSVFHI